MKKNLIRIAVVLLALYIIVVGLLYAFQEDLLFFPVKLDKDYRFTFAEKFEELNIKTSDGILLNGLLFKADSSKGVILYLHGNGGALDTWGNVAKTYTALHYDVLILDYRGYGKSEGAISEQQQMYDDVQTVYNELKKRYAENKIIVLGYSIGTGIAAEVAATNSPRLLILQAPYYSMVDMMEHRYPGIPTFILKYKFETYKYLKDCKMPVVIFHGNADEVIYYGSSLKLKQLFKPGDTLITLDGQGHNGITDNEEYVADIRKILE